MNHLAHVFLDPLDSASQTATRSVQPFLHGSRRRHTVPILYSGPPLLLPSSKLPLPIGGSAPHLIYGSLGQPESTSQTTSRSVQPFLQSSRLWQTDRPTEKRIDRHVVLRCGLKHINCFNKLLILDTWVGFIVTERRCTPRVGETRRTLSRPSMSGIVRPSMSNHAISMLPIGLIVES